MKGWGRKERKACLIPNYIIKNTMDITPQYTYINLNIQSVTISNAYGLFKQGRIICLLNNNYPVVKMEYNFKCIVLVFKGRFHVIFNCILVEPSKVLRFLVKEISSFLTTMSAMSEGWLSVLCIGFNERSQEFWKQNKRNLVTLICTYIYEYMNIYICLCNKR